MKRPPGRRALPLARVYGVLEPGPVALLSTARDGHANVMALSSHTMPEFEPPRVAGETLRLPSRMR